MATRGRPKTKSTSSVVSVRIDTGVLEEIDRLLSFRFRTPLGREVYIRLILYGDEPSISPLLNKGELTRVDFRLLDSTLLEMDARDDNQNRSEFIRGVISGVYAPFSPTQSET